MNRRTILGLAVILILVIGGGAYWYMHPLTGASLPYSIIETGDRQHKESGDYYTIQINYPDKTPLATRGGWGSEARAEAAIGDILQGLIDNFKKATNDNLTEEEKARLKQQNIKYSLNVGYKAYSSGNFVSYEFDIFMDTGGAHPNNLYKALVFDLNGNTKSLGDLFTSSDYLNRIAELAKTQVTEQLVQLAGADAASTLIAEGVAPTSANFESFVIDSDRIRIFIPPYQAAAYAAGSVEVQIPLFDIKDILKPDVK